MSIKKKIRRWLPLTSYANELQLNELHRNIDELKTSLLKTDTNLERVIAEISEKLKQNIDISDRTSVDLRDLSSKIDSLDAIRSKHDEVRFWAMFRRDGESDLDIKKRFYRSIPRATGKLREIQDQNAILLKTVAAICEENDINLWIEFGTLLGATLYEGFIPWDDDIDTFICRTDLNRLQKIIASVDTLQIKVVYDYYVKCKQIRLSYTDPSQQFFLDIFPVDVVMQERKTALATYLEKRSALEKDLIALPDEILHAWEACPYLEQEQPESWQIAEVFDTHLTALLQDEHSENSSNPLSVVYGIENMRLQNLNASANEAETVFPLHEMFFENIRIIAPANQHKILTREYGDYMTLPNDIVSHYRHVNYSSEE